MKTKRVALIAASLFVLGGCTSEFNHADIVGVKSSPLGGTVNYARIEVPVGMIVKAHIVPYDDARDAMDTELRAKDTSIVDVTNVVSDHDYAFTGLKSGTTEVELRANGKVVLILTAIVTDQPPLP